VKLGMKVNVTFEQASKDIWLPKFKLAQSSSSARSG
jgi:hypothetical protein